MFAHAQVRLGQLGTGPFVSSRTLCWKPLLLVAMPMSSSWCCTCPKITQRRQEVNSPAPSRWKEIPFSTIGAFHELWFQPGKYVTAATSRLLSRTREEEKHLLTESGVCAKWSDRNSTCLHREHED